MSNQTGQSGGLGIASILTLIFITLKLTDVIDWSWWLVLSPSIASALLWVVVIAIAIKLGNK